MKTARLVPAVRVRTELTLLVIGLLLTTCKKDDPLPAASQEGRNTLGCLVNGKPWIPNGLGGFAGTTPLKAGYSTTEYVLTIIAARHEGDIGDVMQLYVEDLDRPGTYLLNTNTSAEAVYKDNYGYYLQEYSAYITTPQVTGRVQVTRLDTLRGIISGTFEFDATNRGTPPAMVQVRDGRFDINYKTLR